MSRTSWTIQRYECKVGLPRKVGWLKYRSPGKQIARLLNGQIPVASKLLIMFSMLDALNQRAHKNQSATQFSMDDVHRTCGGILCSSVLLTGVQNTLCLMARLYALHVVAKHIVQYAA